MASFTIHGYEYDIASWSRTPELVGNVRRRTSSGKMIQSRIARKTQFRASTPVLDPTVTAPLIDLLHGDGHVWSFDADVYSSKGMGWSTVPARDSVNFKFGVSAMTAASAGTYTAAYTDETVRTVLYWRRPGSGSFNAYAHVLSGATTTAKYKNGATTVETVSNWFTANADGSFALLGKNDAGTNTTVQYDDVVVLPFAATAAQITAWHAQTIAWADLPALNVAGTLVSDSSETLQVIAEPTGSSVVQGRSEVDAAFKPLISVSFNLYEV